MKKKVFAYLRTSNLNTKIALDGDSKERQLKKNWDKAFSSQKSKFNDDMFKDISLEIGDWSNYLSTNEINKNVDEERKSRELVGLGRSRWRSRAPE